MYSKTSSWVANSEKTLSKLNACLVALVDKPFTTVISPFSVFAVTTGIVFPRFSRLLSGRKRTHTLTVEPDDDMLNLRCLRQMIFTSAKVVLPTLYILLRTVLTLLENLVCRFFYLRYLVDTKKKPHWLTLAFEFGGGFSLCCIFYLLLVYYLFPTKIIIMIISTQLLKKKSISSFVVVKKGSSVKRRWKNNTVVLLIVCHCSEASLNQMLPKQRSPLLQSVQDYCIPYFDCRR